MDAHAHLISLGWAGPGHALDSRPYKQKGHRGLAYDPSQAATNTGNGLVKPLLISQRKGNLGIGKKAHEPQAGNEWWLKGFESALGNIGKSESERSSGTSTPVVHLAGKHGGLYSFFVKGQNMEGTIGDATVDDSTDDSHSSDTARTRKKGDQKTSPKKRKADEGNAVDDSKSAKSSKKQKTAQDFEQVSQYIALRDHHQNRTSRPVRPSPVEEFRQVGEYIAARSDKSKKKKNKDRDEDSDVNTPAEEEAPTENVETKEERRERRRQRREDRAKRRAERHVNGDPDGEGDGEAESRPESELEGESAGAKAARRAERKKRKADKASRNVMGT